MQRGEENIKGEVTDYHEEQQREVTIGVRKGLDELLCVVI